jgi:type I restriction enzyme M protein
MPIKKSELYAALWKSCDELRGGMDASQYKDYVLVLLFIKYISDKYAGSPRGIIKIPPGASFADMVLLKDTKHIGNDINTRIIAPLVEANPRLKGSIDVANFNSDEKLGTGSAKVDRLSKLIAIFENPQLDFSKNKAAGDDILGDAYEFLMQHFATESGKSKGQFYTPAEVSRVMAKIIGITPENSSTNTTVYDPTCGSGSLLLKVADEAEKKISLYGQEMDVATTALARMNLLLHNQSNNEIEQGNTLADPQYKDEKDESLLKRFDYVVANPPFSAKSWTSGVNVTDDAWGRFMLLGTAPPDKNGDYAFLLHILASMKETGKGAVILPHGVLFRGNAEAAIRKQLIERGWLAGIIGLPANLFYGTGIPACILLLDKANASSRKEVFMMDAAAGYKKDGNKNRLREQDIHRIVDVFNARSNVPHFARRVPVSEIRSKDYNLNLPRYIERAATEPQHDLQAHLTGGIPAADVDALQHWWTHLPAVREALFAPAKNKNYCSLRVAAADVRQTIAAHPEMLQLLGKAEKQLSRWLKEAGAVCRNFETEFVPPRKLATHLGESLLQLLHNVPMLDAYSMYEIFMVYWQETMMDDAYLLAADGWLAARELEWDKKGKTFEGRVLPKALVLEHKLPEQHQRLRQLRTELETATQQLEELEEEHATDEGLLADARNDNGKVTEALAKARLKQTAKDKTAADERKVLQDWLEKFAEKTTLSKTLKAEEEETNNQLVEIYHTFSENELRLLVVNQKWLHTLQQQIQAETERLSRTLAAEVNTLAERYAEPLTTLETQVKANEEKVKQHLAKLGLVWK